MLLCEVVSLEEAKLTDCKSYLGNNGFEKTAKVQRVLQTYIGNPLLKHLPKELVFEVLPYVSEPYFYIVLEKPTMKERLANLIKT